ncbi:ABC transporter permease subunit [Geodermatophilus normandii]|uniref:ABC transporter permease subunit n=1 Tax=Geodermatophilus normandii TaxID=1137989 RepID=A0A6P0GLU9_9ACTN|nr:ABC transporter permease subunit [Geodermatophilus normandii]NEM06631.1 ABC transporter permease subunit [Geodermatophilus normandii]NEM08355.1 ABC transporter permease subunit [Geodermatophilus normandii]
MSTTVAVAVAAPVPAPAVRATVSARPTFLGILRGELIKLLSLRSTWWTLAATVLLMTGVSLAVAASLDATATDPTTAPELTALTGAEVVTGGFQLGMLTIAVLGALLMTGEYSTGMIRSTLTAVPTRVPVLAAKAIAVSVATAAVAALGIGLSHAATMPLLSEHDMVPALDEARTWQVFGGTVYFLVAAALFALGVGTLLRSSAGAITVALSVLLLLPTVLVFITLDWVEVIVDYLPLPASGAFLGGGEDSLSAVGDELSPVTGILVVAAYALVPLVAGAVTLRRRDA